MDNLKAETGAGFVPTPVCFAAKTVNNTVPHSATCKVSIRSGCSSAFSPSSECCERCCNQVVSSSLSLNFGRRLTNGTAVTSQL